MKATETRAVIDRYFDLMGRDEDFATSYAKDVRWKHSTAGRRFPARQRYGTT